MVVLPEISMRAIHLLGIVGWLLLANAVLAQEPTSDSSISRIQALTKSAADAYKAKDFQKSAADIAEAQRLLEQWTADLAKEYSRIAKAHQLLRDNGQPLPELKSLAELMGLPPSDPSTESDAESALENSSAPMESEPAAPNAADSEPSTDRPAAESQVSFTNDVAPILARHCGGCHIRQSKGTFSAASYAALIEGPRKGPVVVAGDPDESELIALIESGEMPPRSKGFPDDELSTLRDWIAQGAAFDGTDESEAIPMGGRGTPGPGGRGINRPGRE
jgi:hypothetical protein